LERLCCRNFHSDSGAKKPLSLSKRAKKGVLGHFTE
jgi:hypothetical protein